MWKGVSENKNNERKEKIGNDRKGGIKMIN